MEEQDKETPSTSTNKPDKGGWLFIAVGAAALFGLVGWQAYQQWVWSDVIVTMQCKSIQGGYSCDIRQPTDQPKAVNVCWTLGGICSNGEKLTATGCRDATLLVNTPAVVNVAKSEFSHHENCDKVTALNVDKLKVSPGSAR